MTTVMIVDDAEFLRLRISKILTGSGYQIVQADTGLSAVSLYQASQPDVVLMDITMPEMDGLTALREIKAIDPEARVIMLTALGQDSVVLEALKAGALDFVVKPFDTKRVLETIEKALQAYAQA